MKNQAHLMKPEYRDINGYEGLYQISSDGKVKIINGLFKSKTYKKIQLNNRSRYPAILLYKNGKPRGFLIHRLVAEHFIPNPDKLPYINHKNGDKLDYSIDNLEWCTLSTNVKHAHDTGLIVYNSIGEKAKTLLKTRGRLHVSIKDSELLRYIYESCLESGITRGVNCQPPEVYILKQLKKSKWFISRSLTVDGVKVIGACIKD